MNKADLIEALAPRLGGRAQAATAVETLVDVVLREVAGGGSVVITGFGTFEKVDRAPRTGRNPRTGEAVPIAGTRTPRFRPGAYFKDAVADPSTLPAEGLAGARVGSAEPAARAGAPATVRRSPGDAPAPRSSATPRATTTRTRSTAPGAPTTVRRTVTPQPDAAEAKPASAAPTGDRALVGGESITQSMISQKKAQLAKVKNDQVVAREKKKAKEAKARAKGVDAKGKAGKSGSGKSGKAGGKDGKKKGRS